MPKRRVVILVVVLALLIGARTIASFVIDYNWWKELGQVPTWIAMLLYRIVPTLAVALVAFAVLWTAHARGVKFAGVRLRDYPLYARLSTLALLIFSGLFAAAIIDSWTVVRFFGGRQLGADAVVWRDPEFGHSLGFYLFDIPFYSLLVSLVVALSLLAILCYLAAARGWQLRSEWPSFQDQTQIELADLRVKGALGSWFLRGAAALFFLALAGRFFLGRYALLASDHGFLVGIDWVNDNVTLPLQWLLIASALVAAVTVLLGRLKLVLVVVAALLLQAIVPRLVSVFYVRPNEISLQRPYIQRHIQATRSAFGLTSRVREVEFDAKLESKIDMSRHKPLFDNVRLWDWRAFHDTVTQIQALRPYYVFHDTDVDRYVIDGQLRQVLLTPRELDINQVADAGRWINSRFIYTHGYGMVMAEANRITPEGMPMLFIKDAPAVVQASSGLKLTRPELYYGEVTHEPVFVRTGQNEFNFPSGSENVHSRYDGLGGFPISSLGLRLAAALSGGEWNILLTGYLAPESRMMIHRQVGARLEEIAGFLQWDPDPYLVLTEAGRLVWIVDGYATSDSHPYSRHIEMQTIGRFNYIRNSVKATVDAYDGTTKLYVFEPADPVIQAYRKLFPHLMIPADQMPADLRAHARYPEQIFRAQAEVYRTYHMQDPDSFYNKEDLWDVARSVKGQESRPDSLAPTYVVATLPDEPEAEFMLILPFTPRAKDNLIGLMAARCDGKHLGELVFLQLSKQALIFGPMQVEARINQDQNISKDLSLWNQQGSQVLRGQMLVLPVEDTFVYIEPIYIQASQARMPQLKKIAMAMGNTLIYTDSYEQAVAELARLGGSAPPPTPAAAAVAAAAAPQTPAAGPDRRIEIVRQHLERYRSLAAQGKWAEAGKELEAVESLVRGGR
jgi:uncharacterized membrane protein (UPF0182 family)